MNDDQLHDRLHAAVPEPPRAPDRATGARERHRRHRRRTTIGVVAASAAVVAMLAAVPVLTSEDGVGDTHPTSPSRTPAPVDPQAFTCPRPRAQAQTDTVAPGAVAVHLCQGNGNGFDAPADALVTDLDELADLVNKQPRTPAPGGCSLDLGTGYVLAFEYADGTVVPVAGELYGCRQLTVGTTTRANPERPWRRFLELLREQRATLDPPADAASPPQCRTGGLAGLSPVGRPQEMVAATLCVTYHAVTDDRPQPAPVSDKQLEVLLEDRVPGDPPPYDRDRPALLLIGETAWGDRTQLSMDGDEGWVPGPRAERILNRLTWYATRPIPTVDASSTAEYVVAAYIDLLNSDSYNELMDLWHPLSTPDLPSAPWSFDYTFESVRLLPRLSAYRDATAVTGLYRQRPADGSYAPYREATFTLGRDEKGVFRIVSVRIGTVVETGR